MNDLVPAGEGALERTPQKDPHRRSRDIAAGLRKMRSALLAPSEAYHGLYEENPEWVRASYNDQVFRAADLEPDAPFRKPRSMEMRQRLMDALGGVFGAMPLPQEFDPIIAGLEGVTNTAFDLNKARYLVALMVDAFPNARPHSPEAYLETLIFQLEVSDFPPAAIAQACDRIVRNETFLPAIAEVLKACEEAKKSLSSQLSGAKRGKLVATRAHAEYQYLEELPDDLPHEPSQKDETLWVDRLTTWGRTGAWDAGWGPEPGEQDCLMSQWWLRQAGLNPDGSRKWSPVEREWIDRLKSWCASKTWDAAWGPLPSEDGNQIDDRWLVEARVDRLGDEVIRF